MSPLPNSILVSEIFSSHVICIFFKLFIIILFIIRNSTKLQKQTILWQKPDEKPWKPNCMNKGPTSTQEPEQSTEMSGQIQGQHEGCLSEWGFLTLWLPGRMACLKPAQNETQDSGSLKAASGIRRQKRIFPWWEGVLNYTCVPHVEMTWSKSKHQ